MMKRRNHTPLCRFLKLGRRFLEFPFEIIQPVILRLYLLFLLKKCLLELLVLPFRLFRAIDREICL